MNTQTAYETFVGCTVQEFLDGMTVEEAVKTLMEEKWWESDTEGTPAPENLAELITEYVNNQLAKI
jgi:hypothetical protein